MPATAGRVRMPANNRVHSSAALQTHGIWQSAIGYDPYAPTNNNEKDSKPSADRSSLPESSEGGENAYASFQGLLALARITGTNADDTRGACKKCGRVGHLTFQCRNFLSLKPGRDKDEAAADEAVALFNELKKGGGRKEEESDEEEEEEESSDSDSDLDPEIEKIIAARYGKKGKKRSGKRSRRDGDDEDERRKRRRYASSDDEDERKRRRRRKSRKEGERRRNHRRSYKRKDDHSTDSDRHRKRRRERRRAAEPSGSDTSGSSSDGEKKRLEKRRRRNGKD